MQKDASNSSVRLCIILKTLTCNFGSSDVQAGLVLEFHLLVVTAGVKVGQRVVADLASASLGVAEGEGSAEGTLDQVATLPEHGVERGVPGDGVAQRLHGVYTLLTVT